MSGLVTTPLRVLNANQFVEMFSEPEDNIYFFLGKYTTWATEENLDVDDNNPPIPQDSFTDLRSVWSEMIALKKVQSADISLGLHRYDWTHGTVFDAYDDRDGYLRYKKWYMVTSQNQVFVCLNNGRVLSGGQYVGAQSTFEPFYDSVNPTVTIFNTPDGYTWMYLYSISPSDFLKFATPSWMPCISTEDDTKTKTGIYSAIMDSFGTGYSAGDCTVTISGDGTGATATPVVVGGQITQIVITNPGTGYTYATVTINGANTVPAAARAVTFDRGGFGGRPAYDLGAYFVLTSVALQYGEGGVIPTYNEYRQFGLMRNPTLVGGSVATGTIYNMIYRLRVSSSDMFTPDTQVSVNGGTAYVIEYDTADPANKYLTLGSPTVSIGVGATITVGISTATVLEVVDAPDLTPATGDVLYLENTNPIYRRGDQQEVFVLTCEF